MLYVLNPLLLSLNMYYFVLLLLRHKAGEKCGHIVFAHKSLIVFSLIRYYWFVTLRMSKWLVKLAAVFCRR